MPSISVRSFAELLRLPAYEQERILYEQKYPEREPQKFKVPYYQPALRGIRNYYASSNDPRSLTATRANIGALANLSRRRHNTRVLDAFQRSRQARRSLVPATLSHLAARPHSAVQLRLTFDLDAAEQSGPRRIFYNLRDAPIEREVAVGTLQIAYWVLSENGIAMPFRSLQYVDLHNGTVYTIARQSQRTMRRMRVNARIIATLWPSI